MNFTFKGIIEGFVKALPIAVGVASYGLVFGVLSKQAGFSLFHSILMSSSVFAGASQFVVLEMWNFPLPVFTIWIATLVVNLRHMLMGISLRKHFKGLSKFKSYLSLFFLVDENWAYSMTEWKNGGTNAALLLGSGICLFCSWVSSTLIGFIIGSGISNPEKWGMDFAFTAIFIFLAKGMWSDKSDLFPWVVAAGVSVLTSKLLPGHWYIIFGAIAGSLTGGILSSFTRSKELNYGKN